MKQTTILPRITAFIKEALKWGYLFLIFTLLFIAKSQRGHTNLEVKTYKQEHVEALNLFENKIASIKMGQSEQEIEDLFGKPDRVESHGSSVEWSYACVRGDYYWCWGKILFTVPGGKVAGREMTYH